MLIISNTKVLNNENNYLCICLFKLFNYSLTS